MSTHPTPRPEAPLMRLGDDVEVHYSVFNENAMSVLGPDHFHVGFIGANRDTVGTLMLSPEAVIALAGLFDDLRDDVIAWQAQGESAPVRAA